MENYSGGSSRGFPVSCTSTAIFLRLAGDSKPSVTQDLIKPRASSFVQTSSSRSTAVSEYLLAMAVITIFCIRRSRARRRRSSIMLRV